LDRDIASSVEPGEQVEAEWDRFIEKQEKKRRQEEGERDEEMAWKESVRRYNARLEAEAGVSRLAWAKHLRGVYRARMDEYDAIVQRLESATLPTPHGRGSRL